MPTLLPASAAPFSFDGFLERCEGRVAKKDYATIRASRFQSVEGALSLAKPPEEARRSHTLTSFFTWEKALRNELVRLRAHKLGKAPERFVRPGDPEWDAFRVAQAAVQCDDPLEGELAIERERWGYVERLETGHYFDLEALVAYALKIQIQERRALFEAERGETSYKTAYREILDAAEAPASNTREA